MKRTSLASAAVFACSVVAFGIPGLGCSAATGDPEGAGKNTGGSGAAPGSSGKGGDPGPSLGGNLLLGGSAGSESGGSSDKACATGTAQATRLPVYLMFVLDGSKSMNHDNKWLAAIGAMNAIFEDMRAKADPGMGAGLIVYSDLNDPNLHTDGAYPTNLDVPIAFVDEAQLGKLVSRTAPPNQGESNTPTGRALTGAYQALRSFQPAAPLSAGGKRVVVLLTDGVPTDPTCNTQAQDGSDDYAGNGCVALASEQLSMAGEPIQTFVIGTGPLPGDFETYDPYFLGYLAVAGGSSPAGCNPESNSAGASDLCYFNIDPTGATAEATQQAFTQAIDQIRGEVASCTIAVAPNGSGPINPAEVNVFLGGMKIFQDPVDGWTYDDPQKPKSVTLHGAACKGLEANPGAEIKVVLGCKTEQPPR
jgi:hypothetical protein